MQNARTNMPQRESERAAKCARVVGVLWAELLDGDGSEVEELDDGGGEGHGASRAGDAHQSRTRTHVADVGGDGGGDSTDSRAVASRVRSVAASRRSLGAPPVG